MDDTHTAPRTITRSFTSHATPIRFTPARVEAIPVPPTIAEHSEAAKPSLAARLFVWMLVGIGWAIFAAWWVIVLQRESFQSLGVAFGLLGSTLGVSALLMMLWTRHNIRIARKGKRGKSSLYIPMNWERDTLGRPLDLPPRDIAQSASEVRLLVREGVKAYVVPDAEAL